MSDMQFISSLETPAAVLPPKTTATDISTVPAANGALCLTGESQYVRFDGNALIAPSVNDIHLIAGQRLIIRPPAGALVLYTVAAVNVMIVQLTSPTPS
jgi:hypothetical protein